MACIAPQPTCNYIVWIPSILTSPFVVERTTLPFGEIESKTIAIRGVLYSIPVKMKKQGTWSCTLGENILMSSIYQSLWKQHCETVTNDILNKLSTVEYKDIYIYVTDGVTGTAPIMGCVLQNCYLEKISPLTLEASGATTPMKFDLTFRYNGIKNPIDMEDNILGTTYNVNDVTRPFALEAGVIASTVAAWSANKATNAVVGALKGEKGVEDLADTFKRLGGGLKNLAGRNFIDYL